MAMIPLITNIKGLSHETAMPHNMLKTPDAQEKRSYSAPQRQIAKARIVGSSSTP